MLTKYITRTPLISYDENIFLKPENLQIFGSYKIRGIATAINAANPDQLKKGLVTISAGNMAQAVAFASKELGVSCTIYIPDSAPEVKKMAVKKMGAEVIELPFLEIWNMVKSNDARIYEGLLIHPVFTPGIQKGYGNIATEIIEDCSDVDAIVVPFGVGGLTSGICREIRELKPNVAIYTCEPTTASPFYAALLAGRPVVTQRHPSFIDAIGTPEVLDQVYDFLKDKIDGSVLVTPEEAMDSVKELLLKHKLLCEGAAGASLSAARKLALTGKHRKIACILSGGNIAPEKILQSTP